MLECAHVHRHTHTVCCSPSVFVHACTHVHRQTHARAHTHSDEYAEEISETNRAHFIMKGLEKVQSILQQVITISWQALFPGTQHTTR